MRSAAQEAMGGRGRESWSDVGGQGAFGQVPPGSSWCFFFFVLVVMKVFIHTKHWREMCNGGLPTHFLDMTVVNILPYLFYLFKNNFTKVF